MYRATVPSQGAKGLQWAPMLVLMKPLRNCTAHSRAICTLPGLRTLSFRVSSRESTTSKAIMIHVTTTESATGMPPSTGMVKTVLFPSSLTSDSLNSSSKHTSPRFHGGYFTTGTPVLGRLLKVKKL